ncbi:MAG TPA: cation-transporting P-type ATPase [Candidatus Saccharimonadales bacterium]
MHLYQKRSEDVLRELRSTVGGLSNHEAALRRAAQGPNSIVLKTRPLWRTLVEPFASIFMLVLFVAAIFSLFQHTLLDAIIILSIMAVSAIIYYVQHFSTEKILKDLQEKSTQAVIVWRGGRQRKINATELVTGDIITLNEGEKVPADARIIHASNVRVDESLLTGESMPVDKQPHPLKGEKETYEQTNILFQGSFIVSGEATAAVTAIGNATEFGQIAALATRTDTESPVQRKIDKLLTQIVVVVGVISLCALALSLYRNMELAAAVQFVLTLAVSAVPEGLPVAITVILVLGMRRMARRKALVRNMRAIETIGVVTTIATDKTGTLTRNILSLQHTWQSPHTSLKLLDLLPLTINETKGALHDPLDKAIEAYADAQNMPLPKFKHIATLPFDHRFAMSGNIWQDGDTNFAVIKGSPEHVLRLTALSGEQKAEAEATLQALTKQGHRVIAVAKIQRVHSDFALEQVKKGLSFLGFIAVSDILRPEAKASVLAAKQAGISVHMITGDHFETAFSIAKQLGIASHRNEVFDSRQMHDLSDAQLQELVKRTTVFARVVPEQKYRILGALKHSGIAAMTGDGVNDVPALANAHVGIAMGSGSQIAKDAGDMILLDNNFKSIIEALREGRIIFSNIRRMLFYLLTTTTGEMLTMLGALLIGMPVPVAPVQILWINLVTDTALVIPLGLEPGEKNVMRLPPRRVKAPILSKLLISRLVLLATVMAITALCTFQAFAQSHGVAYAQTITFTVLVVMQWANALNARSESESIFTRLKTLNGKFYAGLSIAIALQWLALFGPLQSLLRVTPVSPADLAVAAGIGIGVIIAFGELHKYISRRLQSTT